MTQTGVRHGRFGKVSAVEGQAEKVWSRKESVGSNEVRV